MLIGSADKTIHQQNYDTNKMERNQAVGTGDKAENTSKIDSSSDLKEPRDEYIPSGDKPNQTSGIYRLEKDENGQQKVVFDRPTSSEKSDDKKEDMQCTVNTDKVDAEIKKLKEEKQQIEQELKNVSDDENKRKDLEKQRSQVEAELSTKDNDAYRKQNATYTNS